MSKIAKKPILLKDEVTIQNEGSLYRVMGPKGQLEFNVPKGVVVKVEEGKIQVTAQNKSNFVKPFLGLTRATLANYVKGVSEGFEKKLEMSGVGYRAQAGGDTLTLSVGYSHPVIIKGQPGISFKVEENVITVSGIDKVIVGDTADRIRRVRPPEPYKGKGIKYVGEYIRRKAGKAAKALTGGAK